MIEENPNVERFITNYAPLAPFLTGACAVSTLFSELIELSI